MGFQMGSQLNTFREKVIAVRLLQFYYSLSVRPELALDTEKTVKYTYSYFQEWPGHLCTCNSLSVRLNWKHENQMGRFERFLHGLHLSKKMVTISS